MKRTLLVFVTAALVASPAHADPKTKAAQEVAEIVMAKFGSKAASSLPALTRKIETYAARYGEDMLLAVRRVGPEAFALVDTAGADGVKAARVLAQHGEEGATWVLRRPKGMSQYLRYGDDAAAALVKHPGLAEPLVEKGGLSAVKALGAVTPQNGRRIAMLMEGDLGKVARSTELLEVISQYGNRAAEFVWKNKGSLTVATALAAFLANPEAFLNGTMQLAKTASEATTKPLAEGVAHGTNWTVVFLVMTVISIGVGLFLAVKYGVITRSDVESVVALATPSGRASGDVPRPPDGQKKAV